MYIIKIEFFFIIFNFWKKNKMKDRRGQEVGGMGMLWVSIQQVKWKSWTESYALLTWLM